MSPELIKDVGLPIAIVIACAYFFIRLFWPWMTDQVKVAQQQTRDTTSLVAGLRETMIQHTEVNRAVASILERIERKIDAK